MCAAGKRKRAGRATNEGRVFVKESGTSIGLVEIACETDFVARNADFITAGEKMAGLVIEKGWTGPNAELEGMVKDIASVIKENISLKRVRLAKAGAGEFVHSYVHGEGKIGVIVKARADKPEAFSNPKVTGFIHDVDLHIAAFNPMFLDQSKPEKAWVKEQEEIFAKQVELDEKLKTKPQNVIDGVLKGKLKKLMAEVCLLDQGFVKDEKQSVSAFMASVAKEAGVKLELLDYQYIKVGEA